MKSRRPSRLPRSTPPDSAEREYFRFLNRYASEYIRLLRNGLDAVIPNLRKVSAMEIPDGRKESRSDDFRMDENIEEKIKRLLANVGDQLNISMPDIVLRNWVAGMIGQVNKGAKKSTQKQIHAAYPADNKPDLEPLMHDKKLNPFFQNVIDENIGLIKSIRTGKEELFKNKLVSLITQDATAAQIQEAIKKYIDPVKGHAATIARDQVGKLNGALVQYRQQQLGGKRYIWHNSKDSRVAGNPSGLYPKAKPSHWKREGKVYFWSNPPAGGHPGKRVKCRCWAEMVLDDILD